MEPECICPITQEAIIEPVVAPDGCTYEKEAIEKWIRTHGTSPQTREPLELNDLFIIDMSDLALEDKEDTIKDSVATKASMRPNSMYRNQSILHIETPNTNEVCASSHVVCVIDISRSMVTEAICQDENGIENKSGLSILDVVKFATLVVAKSLRATDKLSIVTFSNDATTVLEPTFMDKIGIERVEEVLNDVVAKGMTNLWAGIKTGVELVSSLSKNAFMSSVFVLTDGIPNIDPPLGYERSLRRLLDNHPVCSLSTFGFGYNLHTNLLNEIATIGRGYFSFIPDAGFVGTCFINALANARCTFGTNAEILIKTTTTTTGTTSSVKKNLKFFKALKTSSSSSLKKEPVLKKDPLLLTRDGQLQMERKYDGVAILLTPLRYGTSIDVVLQNPDVEFEAELRYCAADKGELVRIPFIKEDALHHEKALDVFHNARLDFVNKAFELSKSSYFIIKKEDQKNMLLPSPNLQVFRSQSPLIENLCKDMEGQATEAISRRDWFERWGSKYLLSLAGAHLHQHCNNFKDFGVQAYGKGKLFVALQEELNDIFENIPVPRPQNSLIAQHINGSAPQPQISSMSRQFNNSNNVCVHAQAQVEVIRSGDLLKPVQLAISEVMRGDSVRTEAGTYARVLCVVATECRKPIDMVRVGELLVTPYHPIKTCRGWEFPINCNDGELVVANCESGYYVFNLILERSERHKAVMMDGVPCITLGHGIADDPVLHHEYFGSEKVVGDLMKFPGASTRGFVLLYEQDVRRKNGTGDINKIAPERTSNDWVSSSFYGVPSVPRS